MNEYLMHYDNDDIDIDIADLVDVHRYDPVYDEEDSIYIKESLAKQKPTEWKRQLTEMFDDDEEDLEFDMSSLLDIEDYSSVYEDMVWENEPKAGAIFINDDGKFYNLGENAHSSIFMDFVEYTSSDYINLMKSYNLIMANSGVKDGEFPYMMFAKSPTSEQEDAILKWLDYLYLVNIKAKELQLNFCDEHIDTIDLTKYTANEVLKEIKKFIAFECDECLKEEKGEKEMTIKDQFKFIMSDYDDDREIFDKDGYIIPEIYDEYKDDVMFEFYNGNEDLFKRTCDREGCFKEEEKVEEAVKQLEPQYDARQSFYGKAFIDAQQDGSKTLYSYDTPVCHISKDGKVKLLLGTTPATRGYEVQVWNYSPTTLRHVKEFLRQNGFKADSVKQMEKDYEIGRLDESKSCKEEFEFDEAYFEEEMHKIFKELADACNEKFPEAKVEEEDIKFDDSRYTWSLFIDGDKLGLAVRKFGAWREYLGGDMHADIAHNGRTQDDTVELGKLFAKKLEEIEKLYHDSYIEVEEEEIEESKECKEECEDEKDESKKCVKESLKIICDFIDYTPWSGAKHTYEIIENARKLDDLEAYLEDIYPDGLTITELNDLLWFDGDQVLDYLGLREEESEDDEESDDEEE